VHPRCWPAPILYRIRQPIHPVLPDGAMSAEGEQCADLSSRTERCEPSASNAPIPDLGRVDSFRVVPNGGAPVLLFLQA